MHVIRVLIMFGIFVFSVVAANASEKKGVIKAHFYQ